VTLIDSSAWVEFLRGTGSAAHLWLRRQVTEGAELATTGPIEMEVLAGARDAAEELRIEAALGACETIAVAGADDWRHAAAIYRTCRQEGVTPRRLMDCLIAAVAVRVDVPLLAQDRDFELIARHTPLRLAA